MNIYLACHQHVELLKREKIAIPLIRCCWDTPQKSL